MFGVEDYDKYVPPSQIIGFAYPGEYDYEFLKRADRIKINILSVEKKGAETPMYSIEGYGDPPLKFDKKAIADILIGIVKENFPF